VGQRRHALRTYRTLQAVFGPVARFLFRTQRVGVNRIPKRGPAILVTNHVSNLDPVVVVLSMHRPIFHLGKHTLFTKRFRSWFFQTLGGQIPVNREKGGNEAAIQAAVAALRKGFAIGIYPEAHRSPDGRLRRGKPGLGRIAYLSGAPCYPVAVDGTFHVWPKGKKMPRLFRRTRVIVGEPRAYPVDAAKAESYDACQAVTDELMSDIARLLGQDYDPTRAPPARAGPATPQKF
jgi:1-acyl-sn-glycerol-3-phosphate acyltransferase